ncbi:DUF4931 domain-containing protein|uniref:Galactose-1-phosphate uridylyltransferase n=1 Tax=Dendrosporobacter quercicolus TaxID=146817 RepID=A0A1G9VZ01_9FIRM|nr:DUF4931 domain-containing protein [Dendrosporobacter quercicolus]NSL47762.1 DUF4931 domain-containing protein [Dendrosporobacter quercicolus DSM 1736]SDM77484.1 Galactose-1-phosphate uridylyltransferase [Dendrosporobacter quercicolus]
MSTNHLKFNLNIGKQKPESIINTTATCPFCDRANLQGIIAEDGPILLVKNKYPVLEGTDQTVLIETEECHSELSLYAREHLHQLFRFGIARWQEMERCPDYQSVIFFKNHGPFSGGTIRHPHMQIIGLKTIDYTDSVCPEQFTGLVIDSVNGVELNLSTKPRIGFFEFNVIMDAGRHIDQLADYVQLVIKYILKNFHRTRGSYNLFFYRIDHSIAVKIMPRFIISPLFVGFDIPQISNQLDDMVLDFQNQYLR